MQKPNLEFMRAAIEIAEKNKTPFGAALAMGDALFATAANQTAKNSDPTAHAEIMALRMLGSNLNKTDFSGFTLYSTCEPCPMCMSAIIWSKINTVFYGCDIPTISNYMGQINIRADEFAKFSISNIELKGGILADECRELLEKYR